MFWLWSVMAMSTYLKNFAVAESFFLLVELYACSSLMLSLRRVGSSKNTREGVRANERLTDEEEMEEYE